jgi:pimeloyl-ACP methyl ester carboxylesterase/DNA-binding CsgD family transcriptional regulator
MNSLSLELVQQPLLLSQLIGMIYETAADVSLWPQLLEQMAAYLARTSPESDAPTTDRSDLNQIVAGWFNGAPPAAACGSQAEQTLLACLAPHFQRAHDIHLQLAEAEGERNALEGVMDRLPLGMAIVSGNGAIISVNRSLLSLARSQGSLRIEAGRLVSTPPDALDGALLHVLHGTASDEPLRLPGTTQPPGAPLSLWISRLAPTAAARQLRQPERALVLAASQTTRALSEHGLATLFELTPAEARLTQQLALGRTLDEICQALDISSNTAKTHLKRVFAKVGVKRQSELMQAVYSSPLWLDAPALGAPSPAPAPARPDPTWLLHADRPARNDHPFVLPDGRRLAYSDSGDPAGMPVIFMHGLAGSRHLRHPDDALLLEQGVRLIIPERPGSGDSDPQINRRIADWPRDVIALADHLKLRRFAVIGYSAGTPYALATALAHPDRVAALSIVAAMPPIDRIDDVRDYSLTFRMSLLVAKYTPSLLAPMLRVMVKGISKNVYRFIEQSLANATEADRRTFEDPRLRASYASGLLAGVKRGEQDFVLEVLLSSHDWGFEPGDLTVPTHFWHGEADKFVSQAGARKLATRIPHSTFGVLPGGGHYVIYSHWREILAQIHRAAQAVVPQCSEA